MGDDKQIQKVKAGAPRCNYSKKGIRKVILIVTRSKNVTGVQRNITEGKRQDLRNLTGMTMPACGDHLDDRVKTPHLETPRRLGDTCK